MKPKELFVLVEAAQQDLVVSLLNLKHTMMNDSNGDKKVKFTRLFSYLQRDKVEYERWNTAFIPMKILGAREKQRP